MKKFIFIVFTVFAFLVFSSKEVFPCTTFCLKNNGEVLFGKNYDWMVGDGMVFVNKRGVAKVSTSESTPNPAKWISKYGSVTFNQYGRENPNGGMNEAGLVIELMWLDDTQYPKADKNPTVGTLEWIQYQLDTSATVADVLANAENLRISSETKIHYLINDKSGASATVEFLDGKLVAHTGEKLAAAALANDTYEKSVNYSKTVSIEKAKSESSLDRFTRAANKSKQFAEKPKTEAEAVSYAFDVLANVAQKGYTQWSIVYDQQRGKIHFRSAQSPEIKTVNTKSFDYSCGSAVKIFDINSKESGDVTAKFADYSRKANRDLLERSFNGTDFLKNVPSFARDMLAAYPENFACEVKEKPVAQTAESDSSFSGFLSYQIQTFFGWVKGLFV